MMPVDLQVLRRNPLARRLLRLSMDQAHRRWHAVKVLPWCTKGGGQESQPLHKEDQRTTAAAQSWHPIPRFSIVAAMSLNRIIGVDGALPWEHLEQDRKIFTDLTKDQLVILGRATFHEKADLSHIRHVGCCIVVSTTMGADQLDRRRGDDFPDVKCAASLPEALDMARTLCDATTTPHAAGNNGEQGDQSPMACWVVGGERLYNEAVMHPSLDAIHLSIVDRIIDEPSDRLIRRFPPKYRWDHKFVHVSKESFDGFEHHIYSRNRGYV
jgi:dihydrofolate reductase